MRYIFATALSPRQRGSAFKNPEEPPRWRLPATFFCCYSSHYYSRQWTWKEPMLCQLRPLRDTVQAIDEPSTVCGNTTARKSGRITPAGLNRTTGGSGRSTVAGTSRTMVDRVSRSTVAWGCRSTATGASLWFQSKTRLRPLPRHRHPIP